MRILRNNNTLFNYVSRRSWKRGKRLSRPPKRIMGEYLPVFKAKNEKKMRNDNQLYEIEVREEFP